MLTASIRALSAADWPSVARLESTTYSPLGLSEDPVVLRSRAGAGTSFVLSLESSVAGYLLALPFEYGRFPCLADVSTPADAPAAADLHLHDMVIAAGHRGAGFGSRLAGHLFSSARAQGYARVSLVSVGGSGAFWTRHGFQPRPEVPAPAGYGPGATYMSRSL
ncbi:GNAT family N-acetyltransferase [Actinoplanes sp. NPDC051411]|uniref:GNAT family N-acetyltransferase n=1 Tax=Actinoplanes sp. NPDC051411 TaxID=3155522 RepID=UPI003425FD06